MENSSSEKILFEVDYNYLFSLRKPEEAITQKIWMSWCKNIFKSGIDDELYESEILSTRINELAPKLGVYWQNEKDDYLYEFIEKDLDAIRDRKHVSEWWSSAVVLVIASIHDMTDEKYLLLTKDAKRYVKEKERQEELDFFDKELRPMINKSVFELRKNTTDEDFDSVYKDFLKTIVTILFKTDKFKTKDPKRYIDIFFEYFYNESSVTEIAVTFDVNMAIVSSIIDKFKQVFKMIYHDEEPRQFIYSRWELFSNNLFDTLDDSDIIRRNRMFFKTKVFERTFIEKFKNIPID